MNSRGNTVMVGLVAALIVPHIEEATHVKLTTDDVAALISLAVAAWHGIATVFEHYFPPKIPFSQPVDPAKATQ